MDTPGSAAVLQDEGVKAAFVAAMPLGRMGKPEELASTITFLASEAAGFVDGADFQVDGGFGQI